VRVDRRLGRHVDLLFAGLVNIRQDVPVIMGNDRGFRPAGRDLLAGDDQRNLDPP
jgi:hypothetical protein